MEELSQRYREDEGVLYSCRYHVLWYTKYKRRVFDGEMRRRAEALLRMAAHQQDVQVLRCQVEENRIQLWIDVNPRLGIHRCVRRLKNATASALRKEYPQLKTRIPSLWTNAYLVSAGENCSPEAIQAFESAQATSQRKQTSAIIQPSNEKELL